MPVPGKERSVKLWPNQCVKWVTYATRRRDHVALAMLDRALVYGEDLIVRAERAA